jgi:hypothetical protein
MSQNRLFLRRRYAIRSHIGLIFCQLVLVERANTIDDFQRASMLMRSQTNFACLILTAQAFLPLWSR